MICFSQSFQKKKQRGKHLLMASEVEKFDSGGVSTFHPTAPGETWFEAAGIRWKMCVFLATHCTWKHVDVSQFIWYLLVFTVSAIYIDILYKVNYKGLPQVNKKSFMSQIHAACNSLDPVSFHQIDCFQVFNGLTDLCCYLYEFNSSSFWALAKRLKKTKKIQIKKALRKTKIQKKTKKHFKKQKYRKTRQKKHTIFFGGFSEMCLGLRIWRQSRKKNEKHQKTTKQTKKTLQKTKNKKQNLPCFFYVFFGFPKCALDSGFDDSLAKKT